MQHNADSLWRPAFLLWQTSPLILITGASRYRRCWSLAERPPLCWDKCRILALGTAVSAAGESGHIGSWLPQFSFSLVESKKSFHSVKIYSRLFVLCPMGIKWQHKNKKQLSRIQTKADWTPIGSFQRLTENTLDWNFARRMQQCAPGWKRPRKRSQSAKASPQLLFFPFSELQLLTRARRLRLIVWRGYEEKETLTTDSPGIWESRKINEATSKLQRDVTAGIWLVLHAASRSRCGSSLFSTRRGSKKCWRASAAHSPRSRGPNGFWGFVPCQIQDSVKNKQINKYTKPP